MKRALLREFGRLRAILPLACAATILTAQDTMRVRADNPPEWGTTLRLVNEIRIGDLDGGPEYAFGRIQRAAAETGGAFYLFDDRDTQIRRYDARGKFDRLIGRKGAGPGEYAVVGAMDVTRDGLLLVYDPSTRRLTYFRPDGSVHHEVSLVRGDFDWRGFTIDNVGRYYVTVRLPGPLEGPQARHQFLRLAPDGSVLDSILHPAETTPVGASFGLITTDGMRSSFAPSTIVAPYTLGGMITARSDAYRIVLHRPTQGTIIVERAHNPVPLGRAERSEWLAIAESWPPDRRTGRGFSIPRSKPAIRGLFSDHAGRIWVDVYVTAEKRNEFSERHPARRPTLTWKERTTYDVFSPSGSYLGRIQLPAEAVLLTVRENRLYIRLKGSEGEDRVGVFRVDTSSR
jgi:hypothetical protein